MTNPPLTPEERLSRLEGVYEHLATKADIARLEGQITRLEGEIKAESTRLEGEIKAEGTRLESRHHPARRRSQGRDGRTQNRIAQGTEPQPLHHHRSRCGGGGAGQIPAVNRPNPPPDTPDLTLYPYTRKILLSIQVPSLEAFRHLLDADE